MVNALVVVNAPVIPSDLLEVAEVLLGPALVQQHGVLAAYAENGTLHIQSRAPLTPQALRELRFVTGQRVVAQVAGVSTPPRADDAAYTPATSSEPHASATPQGKATPTFKRPSAPVATSSAVQLVDRFIQEAIEQRVSDIHIESYEDQVRVRYRLDGILHTAHEVPLLQRDAVVSRVKVMASLDIAEKRRPQDGRIRFEHHGRTIDLRVSTLATQQSEKIVLRILDKSSLALRFDALGMEAADERLFRQAIHRPHGMVLVTGPTGSGKTTTLYTALSVLNSEHVNITTIEDPVEYRLTGINQTQVRSDIGFTFARALRAFLRQDPNIIMVGEIRDGETAGIGIRAALTGHLVLSTLHTNDAVSALSRLKDMGVEPYLVASSVHLIMAQRLVRRVCLTCRQPYTPSPDVLAELGVAAPQAPWQRGTGCAACKGTGYKGRIALFEVVPVTEALSERVVQQQSVYELRRFVRSQGYPSLRQRGVDKINAGLTTPDEILRETSAL
ncbi:MAG: GspE/PulE family protein [Bacteroidota bacterium]